VSRELTVGEGMAGTGLEVFFEVVCFLVAGKKNGNGQLPMYVFSRIR
jgi:hypothetical protein